MGGEPNYGYFPPHQLKFSDNARLRWFNRFAREFGLGYEVMVRC